MAREEDGICRQRNALRLFCDITNADEWERGEGSECMGSIIYAPTRSSCSMGRVGRSLNCTADRFEVCDIDACYRHTYGNKKQR